MNLQPMKPTPFNANGEPFKVICYGCDKTAPSTEVLCDIDGLHGSYYCKECVDLLTTQPKYG